MNRKATALDVAKRAGVSRSAVSLVLNGRGDGNVAKESQERIRLAAQELNYSPNAIALSLRNQRSRVIGILSDEVVVSPFDGNIIGGADDVARSRGFVTVVMDTERDTARDAGAIETLLDRQVDGLMYVTVGLKPLEVPPGMERVPSVLANCYDAHPRPRLHHVIPDEVTGGREATEHLIQFGHRDIAFLAGSEDSPASPLRIEGYREAFASTQLPVTEARIAHAGWDIDDGYKGAMRLLDGVVPAERPTAIMCANDRLAVGVVLAAARLGLSIPGDLSVMGYDDEHRIANTMVPALTTMALPLREIGREAMTRLLDAIEDGKTTTAEPTVETMVPCRLVLRESTGPATR
ncbi:LacI family DNA-binding transcriptional regulator [Arthrobacter sp. TES]|uniref:LacI family DNA-binding transcriptional regulator n=1 Tax=Paenarthrobacter TaxID=1742992 RepID=UPI000397DC23|nr:MULTISPECIES: LacI family DNA-binding transcriptional regulator [Paenarthrobacter]QOI62402.1 LacI family DNA-binding transcriptional regulator [Arthrobacter sp. TES]MEC3850782.1 LacI family DNA-binding transcriptional regulator [Paenarthrobacter ureafaciens]NWL26138.1 LacI family DNA-binding transcriptional regulator [Paenarthrobacter ureafaciens]QSZ53015.1 LacI family transcriptional regulator [Paenarthrobacter ureafaciens]WOC60172.1 LacI family DNA-binding transcriptional regulator [Paena